MRRLLVALLVCATAAGAFTSGGTAAAQQAPVISLNPSSAVGGTSGSWTITVSGGGYLANQPVAISFSGTNVTPNPAPVTNAAGSFSTAVAVQRRPAGSYPVIAQQSCGRSCILQAQATFTSVPSISLSPPCSTTGEAQTLTVSGTGFPPESSTIVVTYDGASTRQVEPNADSTFSTTFGVTPPNRDVTVVAQQQRTQATARAVWAPCPPPTTVPSTTTTTPTGGGGPTTTTSTSTTRPGDPPPSTTTTIPTIVTIPTPTPGAVLLVTPSLGPGGFVATALGSGFPPNAAVTLGWSPGIGIFGAITRPDGTFSSPVLVMHRDVLGPRTLVASSGGVAATASFLVVPSTVQPSGKDVAQITRVRRFLQR